MALSHAEVLALRDRFAAGQYNNEIRAEVTVALGQLAEALAAPAPPPVAPIDDDPPVDPDATDDVDPEPEDGDE